MAAVHPQAWSLASRWRDPFAILIIGHNLTVSLYSFFEFLADVAGRLLRHGASFEKEDRECQTDCAKTSHPHQTREMDIFLQS